MLSLKFIRQNPDLVRLGMLNRGADDSELDAILALDERLRRTITQVETLKARRNRVSQEIGQLKRTGQPADEKIASMGDLSQQIKELDRRIQDLQEQLHQRLLWVPNLPHPSVPVGPDPTCNRLVDTVGDVNPIAVGNRDHLALLASLGLVDFEAGARIAGRGFPLYTGRGARLERALINFMLDLHTQERGYTEIYPPFMATRQSTAVTGQLPKLEEDMYVTTLDDLFLIPTA
ncbi:MAG: serine--tRNA ligase, partial [Candidatus Neomarinimicrobiota bacterium]